MVNPLSIKESQEKLKTRLKNMNFDAIGSVYPTKVMEKISHDMRPPRLIFLPDENLIRTMIKVNLKFARKDHSFQFLLRFGVLENESFWSRSEDFLASIQYL